MESNCNIKKYILEGIKDLDKSDYIDICKLIKLKTNNYDMIAVTERGTIVDLDNLDQELLNEIYSVIYSKLQRIKNES